MARFDREIPPGGEGKIQIKINTKGYQGKISKSVVVYTSDPSRPTIVLKAIADVRAPIVVQPHGVMLRGFLGDQIEKTVTISAMEDRPLKIKVSRISCPGKVACEIKTIEKDKVYQLIIRDKTERQGRYSGYVTLATNYSDKPKVTIPFLGLVQSSLQVQPTQLTIFVPWEDKGHTSYFKRSVLLTLHKGDNLKIGKIDVDRTLFETKVQALQPGKKYKIEVGMHKEKLGKRETRQRLKIYTNQKSAPVVIVPIRVRFMARKVSGLHGAVRAKE